MTIPVQQAPALWDGIPLGTDVLALVVVPCVGDNSSSPKVLVGAAANADRGFALLPRQFGGFLQAHADNLIVCHDVGRLHWSLHEHFRKSDDEVAIKALWTVSEQNRFIDVILLDQQIRAWRGEECWRKGSLAKLARRWLRTELPDEADVQSHANLTWSSPDEAIEEFGERLRRMAKITVQLYRQLHAAA